jgi:hypothetical protein
MDPTRTSRPRKPHPIRRLEELERRDTPAFQALPPFTTQVVDPSVFVTGDFNGDGRDDIAVVNESGGVGGVAFVGIGLGNGDGTFTAGQQLAPLAGTFHASIITADFNGDGKLDLAIAAGAGSNGTAFGGVQVALGNGDGTFTGPTTVYNDPSRRSPSARPISTATRFPTS